MKKSFLNLDQDSCVFEGVLLKINFQRFYSMCSKGLFQLKRVDNKTILGPGQKSVASFG